MNGNKVDVMHVNSDGKLVFKTCPYRILTQTHKAIMIGTEDVTVQDFLLCIGENCASYFDGTCLKLNEALQKGSN